MSVLIKSQSDICDGMTDIRVAIGCNQPLTFPTSLKKLRLRGVYEYPLILPEGLEEIDLGTYGIRARIPKSVHAIKIGPYGYKILYLPPTEHTVTLETRFWTERIKPHLQPLQIIHNHPFDCMYTLLDSYVFTMEYTEYARDYISKRCDTSRLLYGILKMRKRYARDVIRLIMRAIISNCFAEFDWDLRDWRKIKSF